VRFGKKEKKSQGVAARKKKTYGGAIKIGLGGEKKAAVTGRDAGKELSLLRHGERSGRKES